jgi:hypothetical protein
LNPGEVWRREDGSRRLVLSNSTYNAAGLNRVITVAVESAPPKTFEPLTVASPHGSIFPDRIAMHPRHWLVAPVARIGEHELATVHRHLRFLLDM